MFSTTRRSLFGTLTTLVLTAALFFVLAPAPVAAGDGRRVVKVMTYNMDAGTDFLYLFALAPENMAEAVRLTCEEIAATDFAGRAAGLASQIAAEQPDLVSLQEATIWEFLDAGGQRQPVADQLKLLLAALDALGQHYKVVATNDLSDFSVPLDETGALWIRYLDRDVILARADTGEEALALSNVRVGKFAARITLFRTFEQVNGWMSVDARVGGGTVRFFATHLESPVDAKDRTQVEQAKELIVRMNESPYPVIAAGDFNSDASGAGLGPDQTPTAGMIARAGYVDAWQALRPGSSGFTWPLYYEDWWPGRDYFPGPERIDLVFEKGLQPFSVKRVGTSEPMPSDHAGVVAMLFLEK